MSLLKDRYERPHIDDPDDLLAMQRIRLRVIKVFKAWINDHFHDFTQVCFCLNGLLQV